MGLITSLRQLVFPLTEKGPKQKQRNQWSPTDIEMTLRYLQSCYGSPNNTPEFSITSKSHQSKMWHFMALSYDNICRIIETELFQGTGLDIQSFTEQCKTKQHRTILLLVSGDFLMFIRKFTFVSLHHSTANFSKIAADTTGFSLSPSASLSPHQLHSSVYSPITTV